MANLQKRAAAASFKRSSLCKHYKPACDKGGCEKDAQVLCLQGPTVLGATDGTGCCGGQNQTKGPFAHHVRPRRPAEQPHGELLRKKNKKAISKFLTKVLAGKITSDTQPAMAAQGSFAEWDEGVEETENVEEDVEGANVEEVEKPKKAVCWRRRLPRQRRRRSDPREPLCCRLGCVASPLACGIQLPRSTATSRNQVGSSNKSQIFHPTM